MLSSGWLASYVGQSEVTSLFFVCAVRYTIVHLQVCAILYLEFFFFFFLKRSRDGDRFGIFKKDPV